MGKADLHIHTTDGDGLDSVEAVVEHAERSGGLDVIAVTEHDDLSTGMRARELAARRGYLVQVVPGEEVTTLQGHLVALFVERPVRSLRRIEDTIQEIRAQGGLCFVPHPMSWITRSVGPSTLDRLASANLLPDALELATRSPTARFFMSKARRLNGERYRLPAVGASDAHYLESIGSAYTRFEGSTLDDLHRAIAAGAVEGVEGAHALLGVGRRLQVLTLPVAGLRATPKKLGWRRTAWSFVSRYVS